MSHNQQNDRSYAPAAQKSRMQMPLLLINVQLVADGAKLAR